MPFIARLAIATTMIAAALGPVYAGKPTPVGFWQSADGNAQVKVTLCGNGKQLCARLTSVSGEARTPGNLKLINTYVVDRAEPADDNVWEGVVHFNGQTATGHITLIGPQTITVNGCQMGMCKTLEFRRVTARLAAASVADATPQMAPRTVGLTLPE